MANITFIHRGGPQMASYRYRCAIPGQELEKHGHQVAFNGGDAHIAVFTKPTLDDLTVSKVIKANGCLVIVDIGDNHFEHPELGDVYRKMVQIADVTVAPTKVMADIHAKYTDVDTWVIPDPYELPRAVPHANGDKLLWFGGNWNLKDVHPYVKHPNLNIVTGPNVPDGMGWTPWSPESQATALSEANIVLLPHRPGTEYKTANRLINAVRAGCFVVADPHPQYEEFRDMVWTSGVATGLRWVEENRSYLNEGVIAAQKYVEKHYSPKAIGDLWATLILDCI